MSESLLGSRLLPYHHPPTQHNEGEFFGVEYLYRQAGREFNSEDSTPDDIIDEMDEGFVDESVVAAPSISEDLLTVGVRAPADEEEEDDDDDDDNDDDDDDEGADDDDESDQVCSYIYSANELCITQHVTISMTGPVPPQQIPLPPQQPPVPPQQPPVLQWTPEGYLDGRR